MDVLCDECLDKDKESVMVLKEGKYGEFWGCPNYPKCKFTLSESQYLNLKREQELY